MTTQTKTIFEETFDSMAVMFKCDGCPAKAKVRLRVWDSWPTFLDLCSHHTNRALERYPNAVIMEDFRGDNDYISDRVRGL